MLPRTLENNKNVVPDGERSRNDPTNNDHMNIGTHSNRFLSTGKDEKRACQNPSIKNLEKTYL